MHNRMDSDPSTSTSIFDTSHGDRNHKMERTRKVLKKSRKRCFGDFPSREDVIASKEISPPSSLHLCLMANGNTKVRGEPSHDSKVSECDP